MSLVKFTTPETDVNSPLNQTLMDKIANDINDLIDYIQATSANWVGINHISSTIAGDGLSGGSGSALAVNVDNATLEISSDILQVKDGGITGSKLAAGAGLAGSTLFNVCGQNTTPQYVMNLGPSGGNTVLNACYIVTPIGTSTVYAYINGYNGRGGATNQINIGGGSAGFAMNPSSIVWVGPISVAVSPGLNLVQIIQTGTGANSSINGLIIHT